MSKKRARSSALPLASSPLGHGDLSKLRGVSLRYPIGPTQAATNRYVDVLLKAYAPLPGGPSYSTAGSLLLVASSDGAFMRDDAAMRGLFRGMVRTCARGTIDGSLLYAVVELADADALLRVLSTPSIHPSVADDGSPIGLRAWLANVEQHQRADQRGLQAGADAALAAFDGGVAAKAAAVSDLASRMEADGFQLVTRGVKPRTSDDVDDGRIESRNAKAKAKRGEIALPDFYRFQNREDKIGSLKALRERFEDDRRRVAKLQAARVFKPL